MKNESIETNATARDAASTLTSDGDGLEAIRGGPFAIGVVPEVNGAGALEEKEFVPTRHELSILARYWLKKVLEIEFAWFCYPCVGSSDMRVRPFGYRRLGRIKRILGADAIETLDREVMSELEAKVDPRLWKMFVDGGEPERDEQGFPVFPPVE